MDTGDAHALCWVTDGVAKARIVDMAASIGDIHRLALDLVTPLSEIYADRLDFSGEKGKDAKQLGIDLGIVAAYTGRGRSTVAGWARKKTQLYRAVLVGMAEVRRAGYQEPNGETIFNDLLAAGFAELSELARYAGTTVSSLHRWRTSEPELYRVALAGARVFKVLSIEPVTSGGDDE